ncbi:Rhombotin-1, partial [Araneus ventricosus]
MAGLQRHCTRWRQCRRRVLCVGICEVFFGYERSACIPTQKRKRCTSSFVVCARNLAPRDMDMKAEGSRNSALPVDSGSITRPLTESANCAACQKPIRERYLLKALDQFWHEDCLKCACCDCRLGEVGSTLFTKANLILCKRDYL